MRDVVSALEDAEAPLFVTHRRRIGTARGSDRTSGVAGSGDSLYTGRRQEVNPTAILEATGTEPVERAADIAAETIVVLDAPSAERIEPIVPTDPIVIDHHEPGDLCAGASAVLVDTDADATAALVARLATEANWQISPTAALSLLVVIFGDTGNLTDATGETVRLMGELIGNIERRAAEFPDLVDRSPDAIRETARTLGLLRASGYRSCDWFVAFSAVGGHESAAADTLRRNGVDLALVLSEQPDGYRVTARASGAFAERVNLGESLLPELADEFGASGGRHDAAGVVTVHADDRDAVEQYALEQIERRLGIQFGAVSGD